MFGSVGFVELLLIVMILVLIVLPVWATSRIAKKAGFSPYWSIVVVLPFANVVLFWVFAFVEWPNVQRPSAGTSSPES